MSTKSKSVKAMKSKSKIVKEEAPTGMSYLYQRPGFLLRRCHQLSVSAFRDECGDLDLTPAQFGVLYAADENPGSDQIAAARLLGLDRSTIGNVIDRLVARGYIKRDEHLHDRRRHSIFITPDGKKILKKAFPAAARAHARLMGLFSELEGAHLLHLLNEMLSRASSSK